MVELGCFSRSTVISRSSFTRTSEAEVESLMSFPPSWSKITSGLILSTINRSRWNTCGTVLPPTPWRCSSRLSRGITMLLALIQLLKRLMKLWPKTSALMMPAFKHNQSDTVSLYIPNSTDVCESSHTSSLKRKLSNYWSADLGFLCFLTQFLTLKRI